MLYYDTYSIYPLLQFNQIMTTVARFPRDLSVRVLRSADPEERARRAGAYVLLEKMVRKYAQGFKNGVESIVKPEYGAFFESGGALAALRYDSYGKPFFEGHTDVTLNLSHSHHLVSCVLCIREPGETARPVGIDTQIISPDTERAARIAERYFTEGERQLMDAHAGDNAAYCREFTRIWTRKEALLKYWGVGLPKISEADTQKIAEFGCRYLEKEEPLSFRNLQDKDVAESYITTVCAPLDEETAPNDAQ